MSQVGKVRLMALRLFYFLVGTSFGFLASFDYLYAQFDIGVLESIIKSILIALALLALIGIVQPLRMLPLLFFSVFWKCTLLALFLIPTYLSEGLDESSKNILLPLSLGLLVTLIAIPWRYSVGKFFTFKAGT